MLHINRKGMLGILAAAFVRLVRGIAIHFVLGLPVSAAALGGGAGCRCGLSTDRAVKSYLGPHASISGFRVVILVSLILSLGDSAFIASRVASAPAWA